MTQRNPLDDFNPNTKLSDQLAAEFANKPRMIKSPPPTEFHPVAEKLAELLAHRHNDKPSQMLITSFILNLDRLIRKMDVNDPLFANKLLSLLNRPIHTPTGMITPYPSTEDKLFLRDAIESATGRPVDPSWYEEFNIPIEQIVRERLKHFQNTAEDSMTDYEQGFADGYRKAHSELSAKVFIKESDPDGTDTGDDLL